MWGFNCSMGRYNFNDEINKFMKIRNYKFKRMDDMYFLDYIFDDCLKKGSVLQHDTFFDNKWGKQNSFQNVNMVVVLMVMKQKVINYNIYFTGILVKSLMRMIYPVNESRDKELFNNQNYLKIMKNRRHLFR